MRHRGSNRIIIATLAGLLANFTFIAGGSDEVAHARDRESKRRADVQGITRQAPNAAVADVLV